MKVVNKDEILRRKEAEERERLRQVKLLVRDFLETKETDNSLAKKYNMSSATVGRRLVDEERIMEVFPENGREIYNQIMSIRREKAEQEEKDILEKTKILVKRFLETNESDIELSLKTGISSSTVGRRLTDKARILKLYPENGEEIFSLISTKRSENQLKGKALGGQTSVLNHGYLKDENGRFLGNTKFRLDLIFDREDLQIKFLKHLILTFRAKLPLITELFPFTEKDILEKILYNSGEGGTYISILYLFYHDTTNQDIARRNIIVFYRDILNAIKDNDVTAKKYLLSQVSDYQVLQFRKEHQPGTKINDQQLGLILNYQLKYALNQRQIADIFNIDQANYSIKLKKYLSDKPELQVRYEALCDYNLMLGGRKARGYNGRS